jgi:hypothetical protein
MKISKRQLKRIIKEELDGSMSDDHHWPRISWDTAVGELTDKWTKMEEASFDPGDPSMTRSGEISAAEAKRGWDLQVDAAGTDLEAELVIEIRKVALKAMKDITNKLINGEYA